MLDSRKMILMIAFRQRCLILQAIEMHIAELWS